MLKGLIVKDVIFQRHQDTFLFRSKKCFPIIFEVEERLDSEMVSSPV
ncbi:Uncharacterised protein [Mycobacteroides abscessus subsp. abscessus]|nr:Uncharacterised protein [Mycobacteroides abscessus subsp. abscessus]